MMPRRKRNKSRQGQLDKISVEGFFSLWRRMGERLSLTPEGRETERGGNWGSISEMVPCSTEASKYCAIRNKGSCECWNVFFSYIRPSCLFLLLPEKKMQYSLKYDTKRLDLEWQKEKERERKRKRERKRVEKRLREKEEDEEYRRSKNTPSWGSLSSFFRDISRHFETGRQFGCGSVSLFCVLCLFHTPSFCQSLLRHHSIFQSFHGVSFTTFFLRLISFPRYFLCLLAIWTKWRRFIKGGNKKFGSLFSICPSVTLRPISHSHFYFSAPLESRASYCSFKRNRSKLICAPKGHRLAAYALKIQFKKTQKLKHFSIFPAFVGKVSS